MVFRTTTSGFERGEEGLLPRKGKLFFVLHGQYHGGDDRTVAVLVAWGKI